jgi:uncharacterized protein DUF6538
MRNVPETHRLLRRQSVWYYRRRVPEHLVAVFGKSVLQFSLGTRNLKEAKRKREIADIEWSARFAAAENRPSTAAQEALATVHAPALSNASLARLVWDYVERTDERFRPRVADDPPENEEQKAASATGIEIGLQILESRDDTP